MGKQKASTVSYDIALLIFSYGEKGGPFANVMEIEIDIVIFRQGIEVGEIHAKEVERLELAEGCHYKAAVPFIDRS